ncbi:MAG TPA: ADP-ribosylglycohydrolase family protein [Planctomycetota bacterium]|nr:ADP-ribosylglycohydrolase family protein [Planctomycetota bacterium]
MANELKNIWLWISTNDLKVEQRQLDDEGKDYAALKPQFRKLVALGDDAIFQPKHQQRAADLLDAAQKLKTRKGYEFDEPSDLTGIRKLRPRGPRKFTKRLPDKTLLDRITGAWLGRCAGCLLGKPIEGVRTGDLWDFLKLSKQWPLTGYIRFGVTGKARQKHPQLAQRAKWYDKLDHMPVDDDTNYTTTGYMVVEKNGGDFTPVDVAQFWISNIPLLCTCTAERVAYRNLALNIQPPLSASYRNVYREWIGAQIRADAFGYLNVGNPELAADFAWRDASISHIKNGIYGEMLMAACIAAAPYCESPLEVLLAGLTEIPRPSRLFRDISEVIDWHQGGIAYDDAVARIHRKWDQTFAHDWCHTNSNAAIVATALLWSGGDFGTALCRAVIPCFDTDCNGATTGSIMGMWLGARNIPCSWTDRMHDTLKTSLIGNENVKITQIARKTWELAKKIR